MPPQVRDLQSLIAEQSKAIAPQLDLINQDVATSENAGAAQIAGLGAQKTRAFGDINQEAQNKGMFFSGFSPDAEAKYTAGTYLPKLAELQATIAQTRSNLLGKKADLNKGAVDTATGMRENDLKTLADWNKMTAEQQFSASQADKDRAFQAQQNELQRRASVSAASASSAGRAPSAADRQADFNSQLKGLFQGYNPKTDKFYTEKVVIPTLLANGYSPDAINKQVYAYRKSAFGE